ncbi:glycoside hydrolase family 13 protein [Altericista sp. CCNU0014]|uniref:glycoside hydrolase family 13 protein n=1 Tax=Altericista sp. CCNU0014 TaxID=3082949 RepID=UPI003850C4B0
MNIQTPTWVKHAVFYQIFPDRFTSGQQTRKRLLRSPTWEKWDAPPTLQGYKGGDLWGVIEQLDYLKDLGITAIYFTPIFQSTSNHRYHTHDYYQVDPLLGGNQAFKELLNRAHRQDIKIVIDGVFNHASRGFFFFNDILENGPYSPWLDWFKIQGWPLSPYNGELPANYEGWVGNRALPVFNHDNPDVREYIMEVAEYWIKEGVDGWRLDVPFEITVPGFWQEFRDRVKAINPEAYLVGEIWQDARQWLDGTQFDGVMNYLFTGPTLAFVAGDRIQMKYVEGPSYEPYPPLLAPEYASKIRDLLNLYPWEIQLTQLNLLASHDTARLPTIAGAEDSAGMEESRTCVKLATLLLFTFPGAPCIYYGDEVGLLGGIDPDSRRGFPPEMQWDRDLLSYHRQLIALRNSSPALQIGAYIPLYAQGTVYIFARVLHNEVLVIAINVGISTEQAVCDIPREITQQPLKVRRFGEAQVRWVDTDATQQLIVTLPPRSGSILSA